LRETLPLIARPTIHLADSHAWRRAPRPAWRGRRAV